MSSISLSVHESNDWEDDFRKIVKEVTDLYRDIDADESLSLDDVEVRVSEEFRSFEQKFLEVCVSKKAGKKESEPVECPECQAPCRPLRKRAKHLTTLCGKISPRRWVYCCEHGHRHAPWEVKQKLSDQYTHRVVEAMCRLSARLDYREASEELSHQGIEVSHTTLHQSVCKLAEDLDVCEQVEAQELAENQRWYVSCDGCHTNSPDGWKEVKVGCIYRDYPQPVSGGTPSVRTESIRYVAGRQNAAAFGKKLYALALQSGIYQKDINTQEIVFIGDGAAWIWNLCKEYFPNAVQIVDYPHAVSHLYDVAKLVFEETETELFEAWIKETECFLHDGNIAEVASSIRALATQHPEVSESLEREARYFEKHANRMQYKAFREKGYMIGSGVIESACKHVVGERCKQAAMRWEQPGINAVLKWRCLSKNKAWERYWYPNTKAA